MLTGTIYDIKDVPFLKGHYMTPVQLAENTIIVCFQNSQTPEIGI